MTDDYYAPMPVPYKIVATFKSTCRECGESIQKGTTCYWRRGDRAICVRCYKSLHGVNNVDDVDNVVNADNVRTSYDDRDARIQRMHEDKMKLMHDIVFAILELVAVEKERNDFYQAHWAIEAKKGADR